MFRIRELLGIKEDTEDTKKDACTTADTTNKDGGGDAGHATDENKDGDDSKTGKGGQTDPQQTTIENGKPVANGQPSGIEPSSHGTNGNKVLVLRYKSDFYLPSTKIPGSLLITAATINMLCISFSVHVGKYAIEFYVALLVYASGGILACLVGFPQKNVKRQNGVGITSAIMSSLVAGMSIAQIVPRLHNINYGHTKEGLVYILNIFLVLVAVMCFLASGALIRLVGRVIFTCWRARSHLTGLDNEPRRHISPVAKNPGIILILAALTNLMCVPVPLYPGVSQIEFSVAFVVYLTVGILGCIAGFNQTRWCVATTKIASKGIAIAMLVTCPLAVGMAIAQIVTRGLAIDKYQSKWAIFYTSIFLEFLATACFCCCIMLMVFASELMVCHPPKEFMEPMSQHHTVDIDNTGQVDQSKRGYSQAHEEETSGTDPPTLDPTDTETEKKADVPQKDKWWGLWRSHLPDPKSQDASQSKESKADKKDSELIEMDTAKSTETPQNDAVKTTDLIDVTHILKDME